MRSLSYDQSPTVKVRLFGRLRMYRGRWIPGLMKHGPQTWQWWRLFAVRVHRLSVCPPSTGIVIWLYTRWGAKTLDVVFDRRRLVLPDLYE